MPRWTIALFIALASISTSAVAEGPSHFYCFGRDGANDTVYMSQALPVGPMAERGGYAREFAAYLKRRGVTVNALQTYCTMRWSAAEIDNSRRALRASKNCFECGDASRFEDVSWPRATAPAASPQPTRKRGQGQLGQTPLGGFPAPIIAPDARHPAPMGSGGTMGGAAQLRCRRASDETDFYKKCVDQSLPGSVPPPVRPVAGGYGAKCAPKPVQKTTNVEFSARSKKTFRQDGDEAVKKRVRALCGGRPPEVEPKYSCKVVNAFFGDYICKTYYTCPATAAACVPTNP